MGTKNKGFHRRSKGGDFGKLKFSRLGGVLETSFGSTTLQEVWILPTFGLFSTIRIVWLCFLPKGLFDHVFFPKGLFGQILGL